MKFRNTVLTFATPVFLIACSDGSTDRVADLESPEPIQPLEGSAAVDNVGTETTQEPTIIVGTPEQPVESGPQVQPEEPVQSGAPAQPEEPVQSGPPLQPDESVQSGPPEEPVQPVQLVDLPNEPIGLTGVVYTDSELELFWERNTDSSIVGYVVSRDGTELATVDALSYFDDTVAPGTTYEYTVQSVNSEGVQSGSVSQFLTTAELTPTINETNAVALLQQVASVANGSLFTKEFSHIDTVLSQSVDDTLVDNGFIVTSGEFDGVIRTNFQCDQAGEYLFLDTASTLPSYSGNFDNCASALIDNETLNGTYFLSRELSDLVFNPGIFSDLTLDEFTVRESDGRSRTFGGSYSNFRGPLESWNFNGYPTIVVNGEGEDELDENGELVTEFILFQYTAQALEGETRVLVEQLNRARGKLENTDNLSPEDIEELNFSVEWRHELFAEFSIQSPDTGNKLINVTTPENFLTNTEGSCFESGQLMLTAEDGSELILDANNGDPSSASLRVVADGIITLQTINWATDLPFIYSTPINSFGNFEFAEDQPLTPEDCV